ncbi:unnamed protein product [Schistosoma margrebowiei]|uniref:Uncharacterized protein n=1 Tax=Schistosoma margrebowiei TaxID=48269 RepID=A0A183MBK2_9TREM|nr:unnamed protein product [Schistosoma margrebowiei]
MNAIQYYTTTNDSNNDNKDQSYERLQSIIAKCPKNDFTILRGDLNAKAGMDNTGYHETTWTGGEKRKWGKICKSIRIQQINYKGHNIPKQTNTQSYMDLNVLHYGEPDRSYLYQQKIPKDNVGHKGQERS